MSKVFVSYNKADRQWAEWIGWHLEEKGYETVLQAWDFTAGSNFVLEMHKAAKDTDCTIAVLSPDYLGASFTQPEWAAAFARDPESEKGTLIPVRVRKCNVKGLLGPIVYIDLVGLEEERAKEVLIQEMSGERKKPDKLPAFPGDAVPPARRTVPGKPPFPLEHIFLSKLPTTGPKLFGREKELEILDNAWKDDRTHVVTLIAWGGVGKTALVNHWLNGMETQGFRGAEKVYAWSFYSQGAAEGKQASADEFMQETLRWFGDEDPTQGSAVDKGRRLANLVRQSKTLLILDGMEPLQHPPGKGHGLDGQVKDPGLKTLLKELAASQPGLCVLTSRERVTDLSGKADFTVKEIQLEHLSDTAGVLLLKNLGITGREKDISAAAKEYGGHALALTLLGRYIHTVYNGDIRKRDKIKELAEEKEQGEHAKRIMKAYECLFQKSPKWKLLKWCKFLKRPLPELSILYMLGLFDRPVEKGAIDILKSAPAIKGVTEQLGKLSEKDWQYALCHLRDAGLLAKANPQKPGDLDCHPLIRKYFGERLKEQNPGGWKDAHTRLYHYYKSLPGKELPDTLEEMEPLFAAIAHGCQAGLHQEVLVEVYWKRVARGNEAFIVKKLGAFGSFLAALSHFFEVPWS